MRIKFLVSAASFAISLLLLGFSVAAASCLAELAGVTFLAVAVVLADSDAAKVRANQDKWDADQAAARVAAWDAAYDAAAVSIWSRRCAGTNKCSTSDMEPDALLLPVVSTLSKD